MSTTQEVDQLRARARSLRRTAASLDGCAASRLWQRAGVETWIGPTPARCLDDLQSIRSALAAARDELLAAAGSLERRADALAAAVPTTRIAVS